MSHKSMKDWWSSFKKGRTYSLKKAVRQRTEISLPDGVETAATSSEAAIRMRRSSSMPSVYEASTAATISLRHYDYDSKLNRLQKRSLRFTWHRLKTRNGGKRVELVFEEVYDRLLRQQSCIRDMFTTRTFLSAMSRSETATPRDHAKETVRMIDHVIKNLELSDRKRSDTGSDYDPFLLGRAHGKLRPYGLTGNHWEKLGEIIVDVVLAQEAVRDLPGAGQAWVVLTACLVDQLRAGFDESKSGLTVGGGLITQKVICDAAAELEFPSDESFDSNTGDGYTDPNQCPSSSHQYYNQQSQHGTTSATTSYSQRSESSARDESHEHRSPTRKHQQGTRALSRRMSKDQYMSGKMSQQHNESQSETEPATPVNPPWENL